MRKVLLSFLGAGEYEPCVYTYEGKHSRETRFVQTAIYEHFSQEKLEIILFTTERAKETNWEDGMDRNGQPKEGLRSALNRMVPEAKVKLVHISSSQDEEANWQLFNKILGEIQEGDEIYFDMTHSFRSIPIIAFIVLNYVRFVKNAKIKKLVYGLFDPANPKGPSPLVDMTNMLALLDWTNGVDQFIRTGDASLIKEITNKEVGKIQRNQEVSKEEKANVLMLKQLAVQLELVGKSFQTCRSLRVTEEIEKLRQKVKEVTNISTSSLKPLEPLVNKIEEKYKPFGERETMNGLLAAKWCKEHGLIQPAITMLQENVITAICKAFQLNERDKSVRLLIPSAIKLLQKNEHEENWNVADEKKPLIRELIETLRPYKELLKSFDAITDYRNDINHAGTSYNFAPEKIENRLKKYIEDLTPFFEQMDKIIEKG